MARRVGTLGHSFKRRGIVELESTWKRCRNDGKRIKITTVDCLNCLEAGGVKGPKKGKKSMKTRGLTGSVGKTGET